MSARHEVEVAGGYRVSYLAAGDGPTIVVVPGVLQSAERWQDVGYLERFTEERIIVIDPLGHGKSDRPTDVAAYAPDLAISHVVAVMEQEMVTDACIWGYSTGAETALLVARRRPDLINGLVIGGTYLGDIRAGLRDVGLDHKALTERSVDALEQGDWQAYFDGVLAEIPVEIQHELIEANDPEVIAAVVRADLLRPRGFVMPVVPTMAYWAEDEFFAERNSLIAETLPLDWAEVPGTHTDGFVLVDPVVRAVRPFLDSVVSV